MDGLTAAVANLSAAISQLAVGGGSSSRRERGKWYCFDGVWWWGRILRRRRVVVVEPRVVMGVADLVVFVA